MKRNNLGTNAGPVRSRRTLRTFALPLAAALTLSVTAYGSTSKLAASSEQSSSAKATHPASSRGTSRTQSTPIRVVIGKTVLTATLWDNATARSLIARLPLTLTFSDLNGQEKIGHLRSRLSMRGMPKSADPKPREIGYYAPWGNLVFYYGDVGRFDGIARIGRFDGNVAVIKNQTRDFRARIELAR